MGRPRKNPQIGSEEMVITPSEHTQEIEPISSMTNIPTRPQDGTVMVADGTRELSPESRQEKDYFPGVPSHLEVEENKRNDEKLVHLKSDETRVTMQHAFEKEENRISQLEALINKQGAQIATLTDALKGAKVNKPKRITDREVGLMFIGDKVVVDWDSVRTVNNQDLWPVVLQDIEGNQESDLIPYLQALNQNSRFKAIVLEQKAVEKEIHQGDVPREVRVTTLNPLGLYDGGFRAETDKMVLTQTIVIYEAKIRFISGPWEGKEITVDTKCFNP